MSAAAKAKAVDLLSAFLAVGAVSNLHVDADNEADLRNKFDALVDAGGRDVQYTASPGIRRHSGYRWHSADLTVLVNDRCVHITVGTKHEREVIALEGVG